MNSKNIIEKSILPITKSNIPNNIAIAKTFFQKSGINLINSCHIICQASGKPECCTSV